MPEVCGGVTEAHAAACRPAMAGATAGRKEGPAGDGRPRRDVRLWPDLEADAHAELGLPPRTQVVARVAGIPGQCHVVQRVYVASGRVNRGPGDQEVVERRVFDDAVVAV